MRRNPWSIAALVLCLVALALPAQAQALLQIYPDQGVGVLSEEPASGDLWSESVFPFGNYVGPVSGDDVFCRTYLRFPLGAIPTGATIQTATLYVYADDFYPGTGTAPISVYPVTEDWTPASVDWTDVSAWPALTTTVATTVMSSTVGWYGWNVTALVQGWLSGTPNYGLAVAAEDLASTATDWAGARRLTADDPATQPYLEVTFLEPTPTFTPSPTPIPEPTSTPRPQPEPTSPPPPAATATPLPPPTPTPEVVLLPETGERPPVAGLPLLVAGAGVVVVGLVRLGRRKQKSSNEFDA